nr:TPA_inf: conotoxin precursor I4 [Conus ebraeus]
MMSRSTSTRFLLLSALLLGMVAMVLSSCEGSVSGETCNGNLCKCPNHVCCSLPSRRPQCMDFDYCLFITKNSQRRRVQRNTLPRMLRGHAN